MYDFDTQQLVPSLSESVHWGMSGWLLKVWPHSAPELYGATRVPMYSQFEVEQVSTSWRWCSCPTAGVVANAGVLVECSRSGAGGSFESAWSRVLASA